MRLNPTWPVLKRYDQAHLRRIALPLGGIGTGTVSLGGAGDLRDWEIANRPAKGWIPGGDGIRGAFFAIYAKPAGGPAATRSFEQVVLHIEQGDLIDIIDHPDQIKYHGQKILFVRIRNYMFAAPFIKDGDDWFLKTIMPSRKATKKYLEET